MRRVCDSRNTWPTKRKHPLFTKHVSSPWCEADTRHGFCCPGACGFMGKAEKWINTQNAVRQLYRLEARLGCVRNRLLEKLVYLLVLLEEVNRWRMRKRGEDPETENVLPSQILTMMPEPQVWGAGVWKSQESWGRGGGAGTGAFWPLGNLNSTQVLRVHHFWEVSSSHRPSLVGLRVCPLCSNNAQPTLWHSIVCTVSVFLSIPLLPPDYEPLGSKGFLLLSW